MNSTRLLSGMVIMSNAKFKSMVGRMLNKGKTKMDRDIADKLNAIACPLVYPTTEEVDLLRDFMKEKFPDRFAVEQIYHYTNCGVVQELFKANADLWCTHYRFMNDSKEWYGGLDLIRDFLRDQGRDDVADEVDLLQGKMGCAPWITSFSTNYDKASMWGMYCDRSKGGFAIGFNRLGLEQLVEQKNQTSKDECFLLPCIYDKDSVKSILRYILDVCHSNEDEHLCREGCEYELAPRILSRIFFLSLIVKHPSFDYENEWRLIVRKHDVAPLEDEVLRLKYSISEKEKPHIVSGLFEKPLREYFSRIVVSPCGNVDDNYMYVEKMRVAYNLDGLLVEKSSSPYNGR